MCSYLTEGNAKAIRVQSEANEIRRASVLLRDGGQSEGAVKGRLPEPLAPTTPTYCPASITNEKLDSTRTLGRDG